MSSSDVLRLSSLSVRKSWPTNELPLATATGPVPTAHTRGSGDPNVRRAEVIKLYATTMDEIDRAIEEVKADAFDRPAMVPRSALAASVRRYVYHVNELLRYGPLVGGAELAWKAAIHLASATIASNDDKIEYQGQESQCDRYHDRLDRRLSSICDLQEQCGKAYWLTIERLQEVESLKQRASSQHRYPLTTSFLQRFV